MENNENTFTKGLFCKLPPEKAPDFILLNMSFKPHEFFEWAQKFVTEENRGWVNIQIKRSKDGSKIYGQLDTYKPNQPTQEKTPQETAKDTQNQKEASGIFDGNLTDEELASMQDMPF